MTVVEGGKGGSGSGSRLPYLVGGGVLALAGLGLGLGLLAPRGAAKPVVAAVVAGGLLGGGALAYAAPNPTTRPVIRSSYTVVSSACDRGDIPLTGGYHAIESRTQLLHFEPLAEGRWNAETGDAGSTSTLCLRLGRKTTWSIHDTSVPSSAPTGTATCNTDESLIGGGFYFPWGVAGMSGSHPLAPAKWAAADGPADPTESPIDGHVLALCVELPPGIHTYTTSGDTAGVGDAVARCFPGDAVLNGGWAGRHIQGSRPVDGGWAALFGAGGGSAYATCFSPSKALGLAGSYVRTATVSGDRDAEASCDAGDLLLGAGWKDGGNLETLRHFEPVGANGWQVNVAKGLGGNGAVSTLCGRRARG